jgi:hypothetical protein
MSSFAQRMFGRLTTSAGLPTVNAMDESRTQRWLDEVAAPGRTTFALTNSRALPRAGEVVVPDAETDADIAAIAAGLVRAEAAGARVVVRCAASLAAVRGGVRGRRLETVTVAPPGRVLVVCGSFTAAAGRQVPVLTC